MTAKEIVLANIEQTGAPRCGMTFDGGRMDDMRWIRGAVAEGYTQKRWVEGELEYYDDEWGNLWSRKADGCVKGEICKPVLDDWSKLDRYVPPVYDADKCAERMKAQCQEPSDKFTVAGLGGWVFDNARYLRKLENYLMDMALYPEEVKRLNSMVATTYEIKIHAAGRAGVDGICIGEDMGTQNGLLFSPNMWREYFRDEYRRLFGLAHEYGMRVLMHSCGKNTEIIPDLIEAGVDVFQFDQPAIYDMPALAALLREKKRALWSPVDIQRILPTGRRDIIEQGARTMCETFKGGLICKNYPDLAGIRVEPEWDMWAYDAIRKHFEISGMR